MKTLPAYDRPAPVAADAHRAAARRRLMRTGAAIVRRAATNRPVIPRSGGFTIRRRPTAGYGRTGTMRGDSPRGAPRCAA
jgi:hypothetical protein